MTNLDRLMWVARNMPDECKLALERFTRVNPNWRGANWEDCLDVLLDSDSHLELTEPLYEEMDGEPLSSYIGVTLHWAYDVAMPTADDVRLVLERVKEADTSCPNCGRETGYSNGVVVCDNCDWSADG